ncbi:phospholipid-transporting ATPase IK-like [Sturnira hondurensis]|uniref:phospholipid-transporting ATPase IK-like n=1 Tax=Sturnira hondurensis TaxID=192404 RepID=UPI00187A2404|nr:phospholipid-transporting ATPase IK-like [Sturnira hondurensis]
MKMEPLMNGIRALIRVVRERASSFCCPPWEDKGEGGSLEKGLLQSQPHLAPHLQRETAPASPTSPTTVISYRKSPTKNPGEPLSGSTSGQSPVGFLLALGPSPGLQRPPRAQRPTVRLHRGGVKTQTLRLKPMYLRITHSSTSGDSLGYGEDFQKENSAFSWEVKANDRTYNNQFKEQIFLCWQRKKYKGNMICTAKYNFFSFLPLNVYEQFHRMSNLYFLFIIILQGVFPDISTMPWFTLLAPLICLLVIRAIRDLVDDIGRHRSDRIVNNRPCQMLVGESFLCKKWKDLCVGDVVRLHDDNIVPADMLLLASTEPSSLCYVETADIDGETNLKYRQALMVTHHELNDVRSMASFQGKVVCEEPNSRMHYFMGRLEWEGKKYPLDSGNILLRGCKIRNTDTCYGMVIYADGWMGGWAGVDTKIMRNCGKIYLKGTKMDQRMNRMVILIFMFVVLISVTLTLGFLSNVMKFKVKHYYVPEKHVYSVISKSFFMFLSFLILLSVMMPMAMFIIAEFIYLGNSIFIDWDMEMYYEPQDMPAKARSTSLSVQLGQVEYIFSDKTGTLTQNIMTFKKCCINGTVYGPDEEAALHKNPYLWNEFADGKLLFQNMRLLSIVRENKDRVVQEFWRLLAVCHTVMVEEKDRPLPDQLLYQAASPDEEALVTAARNFGYVFLARTQDSITVMELGEERVYQVLAMMDFNSIRKRMSVLVRNPEGLIYLYTKGADTVLFDRLHKKDLLRKEQTMKMATEQALTSFAEETLRTLCLAYKKVDENIYEEWRHRHEEASILLQNRAQALHQVYEEMEQNLQLLGVTAIEDKLQNGVLETIQCFKQGNIKVWVLTGDKQETAVNIGFACQLLSEDMRILDEEDIPQLMEAYRENCSNLPHVKMSAMVVTGEFLDQLMKSATRMVLKSEKSISLRGPEVWRERAFVELASRCQAVICCRVTPKQKALIVRLVKKYYNVVTLAIGDGANDVNMIKTADIGVGLAGQEGMQAVQNSDYMLAQFCFLKRLLFVHGRWSYMRVCKFLRYFIYKTLAIMMVQIWFAFYSSFTAQPLYEGWFLALFNLLYTTLPVLYIGLFEQDVSDEQSLELPQLYIAGQKDELFNYWVFFQAIAHGTTTSLVNFFMTLWISHDTTGPLSDYQSFATVMALSGLLSVTAEVILIIKYWTVLSVLAISFSLCFYMVITWTSQSLWLFTISPKTFPFLYVDQNVLPHPSIPLVVLLNVSLNTLPVLAFRVIYQALKQLRPKEEEEEEEVMEIPTEEIIAAPRARRSSYAFSHQEGYANLITQGTILRRSPGVHRHMQPMFSDEELSMSADAN